MCIRDSIYGDSYNDFSQIPTRPKPQKDYSVHTAPKPAPKDSFAAGEMVQHKAFGRGMILTVLTMGNDEMCIRDSSSATDSPSTFGSTEYSASGSSSRTCASKRCV